MSSQEKASEQTIEIPITWEWNEDIETVYVNQLRVTHGGPEFYLTFGELVFPAQLSDEEPPEKLSIVQKVRIVVSPNQMGKFIKALNDNYEKYLNKKMATE